MTLVDLAISAFLGVLGVACLLAGGYLLRAAARYFGLVGQMFGDDAEPVDVADATSGQVAVSGRARRAGEDPIPLPFGDGNAFVAVGSTLKRSHSEGGTNIVTDERATETVPFVVADETGSIQVDPEGAVHQGEEERFDPDEVDQSALAAWLDRTDVSGRSDVGYKQQTVVPGDDVYVYGDVVATDGGAAEAGRRIVDTGDMVVSTGGRRQVGGSSVVAGLVCLFLGGLFLFFALSALSIAAVFVL